MSTVINGKVKSKSVTRKFTTFDTTDGRQWSDEKIANKWQQKLNKTAQSVLEGKNAFGEKRASKRKTSLKVWVSPAKRLATKNFVAQTGSCVGTKGIVSINRLVQSLERNPKLLTQLTKLLAIK